MRIARLFSLLACLLVFSGNAFAIPALGAATVLHDIRPGPGVTRIAWLADWFSPLAGSPSDTRVFILDSGKPGPTLFIAGGTHANEIAGIIAATIVVEYAIPSTGRLIVIPNLNNSASSWTEHPGTPAWVAIPMTQGIRFFKYGARYTNPVHQQKNDPAQYRHQAGGDTFEGSEARNLNRVYPGNPEGTLTERLAWGVMELLRKEKVDIAIDLHEAGPESRLAYMIVANPKNLDVAAMAILSLELDGIHMKLEPSSETFHGLSHREWGDSTQAASFLIETPNPAQATEQGSAVEDPKFPLASRVATQIASIAAILESWNESIAPSSGIKLKRWPDWKSVASLGPAAFLNW
ncbi:MAG: succinylglutamate desuccinylase/aspartoacylase family protein [Rectinema sp.]|nr:succinylglutamate desuccinylase/aspartoacylase family protein [Rectinema sp.]